MKITAAQPLMVVLGLAAVTVQSASCGAILGAAGLGSSVPRTAAGTMPRVGITAAGSGLPGRFRASESVTFSIFTALLLWGEPGEGFPLSGGVSGLGKRILGLPPSGQSIACGSSHASAYCLAAPTSSAVRTCTI